MRKSDIFESFVKIAQEKGLISNDSEPARKVLEKTRSAGTLSADEIAKLYGIKPDSDIKYTRNIMEAAHPEPAVVSPAYDKINGLVENNNERQDIIINQLNMAPKGDGQVRKLAEKDLVLSLVRIANDLDNSGREDLRALADVCLEQTCKKKVLKKEALAPLAIVGIIAAVLGAVYLHQHIDNISEGLQRDYQKLNTVLSKFLNSNIEWGVGHTFDNEVKEDVKGIQERVDKFMKTFNGYAQVIRRMEKPRDGSDVLRQAQDGSGAEKAEALNTLTALVNDISVYLNEEKNNLSSSFYKARHTTDRGAITSVLEYLHLQGGNSSLTADVFQDIVNALGTFQATVNSALEEFTKSNKIKDKVNNDDDLKKAVQNQSSSTPETPEKPAEKPADKSQEETELDDLEKALSGQGIR
jgi:hypothetical protein